MQIVQINTAQNSQNTLFLAEKNFYGEGPSLPLPVGAVPFYQPTITSLCARPNEAFRPRVPHSNEIYALRLWTRFHKVTINEMTWRPA